MGSAYSRRLLARCERTGARWIRYLPFVAVLAIGGFYTWGLGDVTTAVLGLELPARVAIAAVLVGAIGFPMGMPLPIGLAALHGAPRELGFWAWGLNGVSSVVGSIAAILLAQLFGYSYTLSLAMGCYLIALLCLAAAEEPAVAGVQG